ncbi:hypothetical protein HMPREF1608_02054 [Escherichia coli 908525]|nr:hypothetical protein HMPREF9552_03659 [Escherichia coli MS 198-1]EFJ80684.1 hypothetical protein HMPREF9534_03311 [Escherichia coli MS 69-1]EKH44782.1 hypothetical protein ECFRIK1997_1690 [Escherichia coli FRIK1997]ESA76303.1 hypothetical protein HMPREF1588_01664 [Escherichia coli 110957]ESA92901.1 hypothetical protein HMPREF1599_01181 [Escherichia coli 907713]ESD12314.1 hypothetical protein HMPREF1595_00202 [Escherichia coli 907672]ESD29287.1 hypothetical protein HMPREF1600_01280 [Escheri
MILQDFVGRIRRSRHIWQKQRANKNTGVMPVFFYGRGIKCV